MKVIPYVPERLTLARELAGLTRVELAAKIDETPHTIANLEHTPCTKPTRSKLRRLALALGVPPAYFTTKLKTPWLAMDRHISTQRSADREILKRRTRARAWQVAEVAAHLREHWQPPTASAFLDDHLALSGLSPADKAVALRKLWGMTDKPITRLAWTLEHRGITILPLPDATATVAGYHAGRPTIWVHWQDRCPLEVQAQLALGVGYLLDDEAEEALEFEIHHRARLFAHALMMPKGTVCSIRPALGRITIAHVWMYAQTFGVPYGWAHRRGLDFGYIRRDEAKRLNAPTGLEPHAPYAQRIASPVLYHTMLRECLHDDTQALATSTGLYPHQLDALLHQSPIREVAS